MATPSPLNWNQRGSSLPAKAPDPQMQFKNAEDYADWYTARHAGPTGMHEKDTIQSGIHKGKTKEQVRALGLQEAQTKMGLTRRSPETNTASPAAPNPAAPPVSAQPKAAPVQLAPNPGSMASGMVGNALASSAAGAAAGLGSSVASTMAPPSSAAAPATPKAASPSQAEIDASVAAQGFRDFNAGVYQRKPNGEVLFNTGMITAADPSGGRQLTSKFGSGSVSMQPPKVKTFDGMSPDEFGKAAAARQKVTNSFVAKAPAPGAPAPAPTPPPVVAPMVTSNQTPSMARVKSPPVTSSVPPTPAAPMAAAPVAAPAPVPVAAAPQPGRISTLNGKPYKSPLAADMGLPQPGAPSPQVAAAPSMPPAKPMAPPVQPRVKTQTTLGQVKPLALNPPPAWRPRGTMARI